MCLKANHVFIAILPIPQKATESHMWDWEDGGENVIHMLKRLIAITKAHLKTPKGRFFRG